MIPTKKDYKVCFTVKEIFHNRDIYLLVIPKRKSVDQNSSASSESFLKELQVLIPSIKMKICLQLTLESSLNCELLFLSF